MFFSLTLGCYKGFTWQASERKQFPLVDLLQSQGLAALAFKSSGPTAGLALYIVASGFPGDSDSKIIHLQCKSPRFDSWVRKGMATHSSILACRIPWTEEPGGLQSMGLQRVRHTTERLPLHLISVHFRGCRRDLVCLSTQQSVLGLVDC